MIITCPHCQTKYQVTYEAIGSTGRKVQCAHCHQAWTQDGSAIEPDSKPFGASGGPPPPSPAEAALSEDALDEVMAAEESAVAAEKARVGAAPGRVRPGPDADAAALHKQQMAFARRQNAMISSLPLARLRRAARLAGVVILAGLVGGAYFARVPIVERYPDLAGLYEAVGLGVNVVGLEFSNLETLKALSGGNDMLTVSAQIVGQSPRPVPVPPVVVSLLDADGRPVYEWSVAPRVRDLMAGERATFDTRLSLPPSEAVRVRLTFAGRGTSSGERGAGAAAPEPTAAPADQISDPGPAPVHAPGPPATDHH